MPGQDRRARRAGALPQGAFVRFEERLGREAEAGTLVPLHIGDSYLDASRLVSAAELLRPELHRYGPVAGLPELRRRVAAELLPLCGRPGLSSAEVTIAPGATGGLSLVLSALCDPGDEIIVLTPSWPLIFGIIASHDGVAVEVPVSTDGWPEPDAGGLRSRLAAAITPRTAAIYLSDPNNPVGYTLPEAHRRVVAELAEERGLWLIHDAVYAQLRWGGSAAFYEVSPERLVTVGSFSKAYAIAGHRVGWVAASASLSKNLERLLMYQTYHPSIAGEAMALAALDDAELLSRVRDSYEEGSRLAAHHLRLSRAPEAGGFVLLDLRASERDADTILSRCLDHHVALAPGRSFGKHFERFLRLCYTSVRPERLEPALVAVRAVLLEG